MFKELGTLPGVAQVYASEGNFLLVRFKDADQALARLLAKGVVARDMRDMAQLADAVRISIGSPDENLAVVEALRSPEAS